MSECHNVSEYQFSRFHQKLEVWGLTVPGTDLAGADLSFWSESSPGQYKHPEQAGNFWSNLKSFVDNLMMEKLLMETSFSKHRNPVSRKELYCAPWMFWKIYKNKSSSGPNLRWTGRERQAGQKQFILYISFVVGRKSLEKVGLGKMMYLGRGWDLSSPHTTSLYWQLGVVAMPALTVKLLPSCR